MKLTINRPENWADKTDEELVKLTLANQEYFVHLVRRYEGKLLSYIKKISNVSAEEAEDIMQDVFVKVYENLNDFDTDLKFSSWVYRITHNQAISHFRKEKIRPLYSAIEIDEAVINSLASDADLNREMDHKYLSQAISQVLGGMDNNYREILVLKYFEEKNYQEMSDILKKPMGTVASRLNKAKNKFKQEFIKQNKSYEERAGG